MCRISTNAGGRTCAVSSSEVRSDLVVQPATEHGFFPPPCLQQYGDAQVALVVHPEVPVDILDVRGEAVKSMYESHPRTQGCMP